MEDKFVLYIGCHTWSSSHLPAYGRPGFLHNTILLVYNEIWLTLKSLSKALEVCY